MQPVVEKRQLSHSMLDFTDFVRSLPIEFTLFNAIH